MGTIKEIDCSKDCLDKMVEYVPWGLMTSICLMLLILLSLFLIVRYALWSRKLKLSNVKKRREDGVLYYELPDGPKAITKVMLIGILLGCPVKACIDGSRVTISGASIIADVIEGDSFCFEKGLVQVSKLRTVYPISFKYLSAEWDQQSRYDWFCTGGGCPSASDCNAEDGKVERTDDTIVRRECKTYPSPCALGSGCWRGTTTIKMKDHFSAYHIETGYTELLLTEHSLSCKSVSQPESTKLPWDTLVVRGVQDRLMCKRSSDRGLPEKGQIGDLQMDNGEFLFDWSAVECPSGWYWNGSCVTVKPSFRDCVRLPGVVEGVSYSFSAGLIWSKPIYPSLLVLNCNSSNLKLHKHTRTPVSAVIRGKRGSSQGIMVEASCSSHDEMESVPLLLNCEELQTFEVLCDGEPHFFPISDLSVCEITDLTTNDTLEYDEDISSDWASTFDSWDAVSWSFLPHLSWTTVMLMGLLVLLLLRH